VNRELVDDCVRCGFCLPTCPTYLLWGEEMDSPRGRINLMEARLDGTVALNQTVVQHFDRCLGCMACVTACPSGVQYDKLIELTRERVEVEYERSPSERALRTLLFAVLPHRRRLRPALALAPVGRALPLPRTLRALVDLAPPWRSRESPPEVVPAVGETKLRVGLLAGCVQSVVFGSVNVATARALAAHGCEVVTPRGQSCCGALHVHAGRRDEGRALARRTIAAFERTGVDLVVANAAGCGSNLKEYGFLLGEDPQYAERAEAFAGRVRDVSEVLAELAPQQELRPLPVAVAFQESCHLAHAQQVFDPPRALLRRIPELELIEPAEQAICCGSAGIYNILQPDAARALGDRKAGHVLTTGAEAYASANPGCLIQVSKALRRAGRPLPALHPIEFVDASLRGATAEELLATARR
jgi:glycolate dehydrogenase iron-sulfur subunit